MVNEVHDACQYMYSISNWCSDGSQYSYDAHFLGELRLVCYQSTNTLPRSGKGGWLKVMARAISAPNSRTGHSMSLAITSLRTVEIVPQSRVKVER